MELERADNGHELLLRWRRELGRLTSMFDARARRRFWAKVDKAGANGCWLWTGCIHPSGYGYFGAGVERRVHRVSWTMERGQIPAGKVLDHLCRNKRCVNPDHLEPVEQRINVLRGNSAAATIARAQRCEHGIAPSTCTTCRRVSLRASSARSKAKRRAAGGCVECGEPSVAYRCGPCAEKHNARAKAYRGPNV